MEEGESLTEEGESLTEEGESLMEEGERAVTPALAKKAVTTWLATPELLPVAPDTRHNDEQLAADPGALGCPGYANLQGQSRNPAEVLFGDSHLGGA